MFSATVAENRKGSSLTTATACRTERRSDVTHVGAVDQDLARAGVIQPRDQRDEARLARAGRPHERDGAPGRYVEVDSTQHRARRRALMARPRHSARRRCPAPSERRRRPWPSARSPRARASRPRRTRPGPRSGASRRAARRGRCPAAAAGRRAARSGAAARSSTWKMRAPEAVARWARPRVTPSERIGAISMFR